MLNPSSKERSSAKQAILSLSKLELTKFPGSGLKGKL